MLVVIPTNLSHWNLKIIKDLVDRDCLESGTFEFKLEMKSNGPPPLKDRIIETTCAFANTDGGITFEIFKSR